MGIILLLTMAVCEDLFLHHDGELQLEKSFIYCYTKAK